MLPVSGAPVTLVKAPNGAIANKKILDGIEKVAWLKPTIEHSEFRSFCAAPVPDTQVDIRAAGETEAVRLVSQYKSGVLPRPEAWFTYHVYYKAPDWLGPHISRALGIPYVIAEASHAPKRANGPWALGHNATQEAIRAADAVVNLTRADMAMVGPLVADPERMVYLPPFLDPAPFVAAGANRAAHRHAVAAEFGLDPKVTWILAVAMMRNGPKLESYQLLAKALSFVDAAPWQLLIVGDGPARAQVHAAFEPSPESASGSASHGLVYFAGARPPETIFMSGRRSTRLMEWRCWRPKPPGYPLSRAVFGASRTWWRTAWAASLRRREMRRPWHVSWNAYCGTATCAANWGRRAKRASPARGRLSTPRAFWPGPWITCGPAITSAATKGWRRDPCGVDPARPDGLE